MSSNNYLKFAASEHVQKPNTTRLRDSDPSEQIEVSVYLKPHGTNSGGAATMVRETRESLRARRQDEHKDEIRLLSEFAAEKHLAVTSVEPARRLVKMSGSVSDMESAFGTSIGVYGNGTKEFRSHSDSLRLPEDVLPIVESVLGIDNREIADPKIATLMSPATITGHLPNAVGALYDCPTVGNGTGQCIALIELGGGYLQSDIVSEFAAMNLTPPTVIAVSVDGGQNTPGGSADGEVALDIQVSGALANGAKIAVYFAPNTSQGFADAITQAANDHTNHPTVMSISWGTAEDNWSAQARTTMNTALQDAASLGISVFVAAGDNLSTDGLANGKANVDFPASSPWAIGCGGTRIDTSGSSITSEVIWNSGTSGTGGGISDFFPVPTFQSNANLPPNVNNGSHGRGVPDIAGDADPSSGYLIYVHGVSSQIGGTSAVAPLWAGLTALINQAAYQPIGFFMPELYSHTSMVRLITQGNNKPSNFSKGYSAGNGWSGCAGLGVPIGNALLIGLGIPAKNLSKTAVVQWMSGSSVQLRVYYQDAHNYIRESVYNGNQWVPGAKLGLAIPGSSISAVQWSSGGGIYLRVYYQTAGNAIQEECYNANHWVAGSTLPVATPNSGLAAIMFMTGSNVNLRVYYQTAANNIQEQCFGTSGWTVGANLGAAAPGTSIAAVEWTSGSSVNLRVYCQQASNQIQEHVYNGSAWSTGTTLPVATAHSGLAAVQWSTSQGVFLRVYYETAANTLQEECYNANAWSAGHNFGLVVAGTTLSAAKWLNGTTVNLRVYYESTGAALQEDVYNGSAWSTGAFYIPVV